jgi:hypothetical protein
VPPVLILSLRNLVVLKYVGVLHDVLAALDRVALLDVVQCIEFIVYPT